MLHLVLFTKILQGYKEQGSHWNDSVVRREVRKSRFGRGNEYIFSWGNAAHAKVSETKSLTFFCTYPHIIQ